MVNYELDRKGVIKNSFLLSIARPLATLQCLLTVAVVLFVVASLWITSFEAPSATAHAVYFLCDRPFKIVKSLRGVTPEPQADERKRLP